MLSTKLYLMNVQLIVVIYLTYLFIGVCANVGMIQYFPKEWSVNYHLHSEGCGKVMFSLCLSIHKGAGLPQSLIPYLFPASGPRSFRGEGGTPWSQVPFLVPGPMSFPAGTPVLSLVLSEVLSYRTCYPNLGQGNTPTPSQDRGYPPSQDK